MLRFGVISEYDAAKGIARVKFEEDGIVSNWLPVITPGALKTVSEFPLDPDEEVACLMDEHCINGVILGAIFSEAEAPAAANKDQYQIKFDDGLIINYDRSGKVLNYKLGNTELNMTEDGFTIKRSTESLKKILEDLFDAILQLTVTTPMGPSGTPINAVTFTQIKQRIPNLLEG